MLSSYVMRRIARLNCSYRYASSSRLPTVTFFTKDDCQLCEDALEELDQFKNKINLEIKDISLEENSKWYKKYQNEIPVVHINGKEIMRHKVFPNVMKEAISNATQTDLQKSANNFKTNRPPRQAVDYPTGTWKSALSQSNINYFSYSPLYPHAHLRKDKEWLRRAVEQDSTKFIFFRDLKPCLDRTDRKNLKLAYFSAPIVKSYLKDFIYETNTLESPTVVFLGHEASKVYEPSNESRKSAWFVIHLKDGDDNNVFSDNDNLQFVDAFPGMMKLSHNDAAIAAQAKSLLAWHQYHQHCSCCGHTTLSAEGGHKRKCTNDKCIANKVIHQSSYPRLDPVAKALVQSPDNTSILLGRQHRFPHNLYTCLSGFIEYGESVEDAVRREVWEEAGIRVSNIEYHSSQPWPYPSTFLIGCTAKALDTDITIDTEELADARWFDRGEVCKGLANVNYSKDSVYFPPKSSVAHHLIRKWLGN